MAKERQFRTDQRQVNAQNSQAIQKLEAQMKQMAREMSERKKGEFPAQTIPNPGGHQQLKAMTTLKNCMIIGADKPAQVSPDEASTSKVHEMDNVNAPPFPQRLVKKKKEKKLLDICETLRKLEINISLLDTIQ